MDDRKGAEREFEEAIRRASERYERRRVGIDTVWRKANECSAYAHHAALTLAEKARHDRRRARRHLRARFGVEAPSDEDDPVFEYPAVRPERSPRDARGRLLRAKAVMEHAEAENVWRAVLRGGYSTALVPPRRGGRMALKFACEAMRQAPALWAYFLMNDREVHGVREHALAQIVGWLDNETKMHREDASREEKLQGLAAVARRAWEDLRPGEPIYLPNTFVKSRGEQRQKGHLVGRAGRLLDELLRNLPDDLPRLRGLSFEDGADEGGFYGPAEDELGAFVETESERRDLSAIIEGAGLSRREAQVIERERRGEENARIADELGIDVGAVYVHRSNAMKKLRRAAGH